MLLGFEHVGMTVSDMDRAVAFYCDLLGLKLALRKPNDRGELAFFDTGSGDEKFAELEAAGVEVVERPREAFNKEMIHRVAFVRDYDGILVELIERAAGR
jgi:glyoxylase I family protein